jgi:hypothetical protein
MPMLIIVRRCLIVCLPKDRLAASAVHTSLCLVWRRTLHWNSGEACIAMTMSAYAVGVRCRGRALSWVRTLRPTFACCHHHRFSMHLAAPRTNLKCLYALQGSAFAEELESKAGAGAFRCGGSHLRRPRRCSWHRLPGVLQLQGGFATR